MPKGCIIYYIEKGLLEKYTLLSIALVKRYGGFLSKYDIYCVQPRVEFPVSETTKTQIKIFGAVFIEVPLNKTHRYYSFANKPLALNYIMDRYTYDQYIFLDGDTLVLSEPNGYLKEDCEILLSPVYTRGVGIRDFNDTNGAYWKRIIDLTGGKSENLTTVKTVIEEEEIIGYWNAGIIILNGQSRIAKDWMKLTFRLLEEKIYPATGIFFVEQTSLAAVILATNCPVCSLPLNHNFPLTDEMLASPVLKTMNEICVVHHLGRLDLMDKLPDKLLSEHERLWLKEKMAVFKIRESKSFKNFILHFQETVRLVKERFYYFIYKFARRKNV